LPNNDISGSPYSLTKFYADVIYFILLASPFFEIKGINAIVPGTFG